MTTEQKAKAYDEALERLKPLYEQAKKDDNPIWSTYEYLVPELKESEDEKIRKALVDFFDSALGKDLLQRKCGLNPDAVLVYLKKQEEQKSAEWSEEDDNMRNNILCVLSAFMGTVECESNPSLSASYPTYLREIDWLKSLRPQPIQNKFDEAMQVADKFEEGYKAGVYDTKAKSWKPSEHQMTILKAVKDYVGVGSGYWGEALGSLIEDLEKL